MGFFNSIFRGMGFSGKEELPEKKKQDGEPSANEKYSNFDQGLANSFVVGEFDSKSSNLSSQIPDLSAVGGKNLIIYTPKDNNDIKILVECLRRKEACIVNLGQLKPQDSDKILQFLSGAVYALKGSIKRLQGDLFLLAPEGINIMTQAK